jgi:hypothetical protein
VQVQRLESRARRDDRLRVGESGFELGLATGRHVQYGLLDDHIAILSDDVARRLRE